MDKKISYLSKNFDDIKKELIDFSRLYYPNIVSDFSDGAIASWMIDVNASVGDDITYHLDRSFQETQIDFAQERRSLLSLARTNNLKIPGRKTSLVEVELSCEVPMGVGFIPDEAYLPVIRSGTKAIGGGRTFELTNDVDFSSQFNTDGISNRQIIPKRDSNGNIIGYTVKKLELMEGSESKIYTKEISDFDIQPFMNIILPETNVVSVESIIFKEGTNFKYRPDIQDFMCNVEYLEPSQAKDKKATWRFFEVDNLVEDKLFLDVMQPNTENYPTPVITEEVLGDTSKFYVSTNKGMWRYITQKFVTEYTDKGYMKIIFGAGSDYNYSTSDNYTAQIISRMMNNMNLGVLPKPGWTMNILYRVGGGYSTNIAEGTLTTLTYKDVDIKGNTSNGDDEAIKASVMNSLRVVNTSPSVSGKDEPSNDEVRYMIKYNNQSQERCVQLKDYYDRIYRMPSRFGAPYRVGIIEKNNMLQINILGVDGNNKLTENVSQTLIDNIDNYLSEYKALGDYILVKPGKVLNLQIECDLMIDKSFNKSSVMLDVINEITTFFDKSTRQMGEELYTSELQQRINNVNGVLNIINMRIYNIFGSDYSKHKVRQKVVTGSWDLNGNWIPNNTEISNRLEIDLNDSDGILFTETDSMFEIKNPIIDIKLRIKTN